MADEMVLYTAVYDNVTAALDDLDSLEQLHKDEVIGKYDAAVIDKENNKPHIVKRVDRPRIRAIPEIFGGGTLPRKELKEAAQELTSDEAGLIVVGEPTLEKGFDRAITRTARIVKRSVDATTDELASELREALNTSQEAEMSAAEAHNASVGKVEMHLEVDIIPVSDVERSKAFYERLGWRFDSDVAPADDVRIVQFTPPGSGCSVTFGKGITAAAPGSAEGGLVVSDIEAARDELVGRGIDASEVWHGAPFPPEARLSGPDPGRTSYGSFFSFNDPDGNAWLVQEVTTRLPGRV